MTPAEVREVVADLMDETPTIMPDGRLRGHDWRPAGVHRKGLTVGPSLVPGVYFETRADVYWYETVTEWFARSAA